MIYYAFAMLTASAVLILSSRNSAANRWAAFFLFAASIGGLTDWLANIGWESWSQAARLVNLTLTPYGVLMFSIVYADRIRAGSVKSSLPYLLFLPAALMLFTAPFTPDMAINYVYLLIWTAPYYLYSCYLLVVSLRKEDNRRKKRNRLITTLIIVPTLLAVLLFINVAKVISPDFEFFSYVSVFVWYSLSVALLCSFVYGVLGVKVRFENEPLESAMKAASAGTSLLNHTIKNEIGKISISAENLSRALPELNEESRHHLHLISKSSEHMLDMVTRIHSQMKDIVLKEVPCRLNLTVDECLEQHRLLTEAHAVKVSTHYNCTPVVICDPVHIREVIGNLIMNAVEAMPAGGMLDVGLDMNARHVLLTVQDSGTGIAAEYRSRVFDPFFSTKRHSRNFGLGLSYVYNVMRKSGGDVDLASRENAGTTITLLFPRKKTVQPGKGS